MTAYQTCITIFADGDCDSEADGDFVRLLCFGKAPNGGPDLLVGQVIVSRNSILRMHNAITKGIDRAFAQPKPKAKVVKYQRPAAVEGV